MIKRKVSWQEVEVMVKTLVDIINVDKKFEDIQIIVGIPRGGALLGVMLSHQLNIHYATGLELNNKYSDNQILVIDDICDSGGTLSGCPSPNATLFHKQNTIHTPTAYVELIDKDEWIVFPWEKEEAEAIQDYKK